MLTDIIDKLISFLPADLQDRAKGARKALVTGIGALLTVLTLISSRFGFLIPAQYKTQITTAISILTAISTYLVPNEPPAVTGGA
jgi:hypothetical protein